MRASVPPTARLHLRQPRPPPPAGRLASCPRCLPGCWREGGSGLAERVCRAPGCLWGCRGGCRGAPAPHTLRGVGQTPRQPHEPGHVQPCPCSAGDGERRGAVAQPWAGRAGGEHELGAAPCLSSCLPPHPFAALKLPVAPAVATAGMRQAGLAISGSRPGRARTAPSLAPSLLECGGRHRPPPDGFWGPVPAPGGLGSPGGAVGAPLGLRQSSACGEGWVCAAWSLAGPAPALGLGLPSPCAGPAPRPPGWGSD